MMSESSINIEEQLAEVQKQLQALSQLPSTIQETLDVVSQQLAKIMSKNASQQKSEKNSEVENLNCGSEDENLSNPDVIKGELHSFIINICAVINICMKLVHSEVLSASVQENLTGNNTDDEEECLDYSNACDENHTVETEEDSYQEQTEKQRAETEEESYQEQSDKSSEQHNVTNEDEESNITEQAKANKLQKVCIPTILLSNI